MSVRRRPRLYNYFFCIFVIYFFWFLVVAIYIYIGFGKEIQIIFCAFPDDCDVGLIRPNWSWFLEIAAGEDRTTVLSMSLWGLLLSNSFNKHLLGEDV